MQRFMCEQFFSLVDLYVVAVFAVVAIVAVGTQKTLLILLLISVRCTNSK